MNAVLPLAFLSLFVGAQLFPSRTHMPAPAEALQHRNK
jgi:hypothetical protein